MKALKALILGTLLAIGSGWLMPAQAARPEPALQAVPQVNINQASADELAESLLGVGRSKAEAIVAHRDKHGPFRSVEELTHVKGIGAATLERNLERIRLE